MTIELTVPAKERLIEVGFDPTLGARPLRRAVQHEIEDRLSEQILHGELNAGDHVHVDFEDGEFVFTTDRAARSRSAPGSTRRAAIGTGPAYAGPRRRRATTVDRRRSFGRRGRFRVCGGSVRDRDALCAGSPAAPGGARGVSRVER